MLSLSSCSSPERLCETSLHKHLCVHINVCVCAYLCACVSVCVLNPCSEDSEQRVRVQVHAQHTLASILNYTAGLCTLLSASV